MYTACIVDALADPYLLAQIQIVHFSWGGSIIKKYNHTYHLRNYSLYMHTCTRPDPDYFLHFHNNTNSLFTSSPNPSRPDPDFFCIFQNNFNSWVTSTYPRIFCRIHPLDPRLFLHFHNNFYSWYTSPTWPIPYSTGITSTRPPPDFFFGGGGHFQNNFNSVPHPTPDLVCILNFNSMFTSTHPPTRPSTFFLHFHNNLNSWFTSTPPRHVFAFLR